MLEKIKQRLRPKQSAGDQAPAPRRGGLGWLAKAAIALIVLVALFAVIGFFAVPPLAKHYATKILTEKLDRQVSIQEIKVNPFAMTAAARGVTVMERDGSEVFLSFDELFVNLQAQSIIRLAPVFKEVRLTRPYLHLVRLKDGKTYNVSDLVEKYKPKPAAQESDSKPARFSLNNIQLLEGRVRFNDRPKQATHEVTELHVAIPFLSNLPYLEDEYVQPALSGKANGTPFALKGQTKPFKDSLETTLNVDIDRLAIPRYIEYVPAKLDFRVPSGFLTTRLVVSFIRYQSKAPTLRLAGNINLDQFALTELGGEPLLNLAALVVPLTEVDVFGRKAALGQVALRSPEVFVRRENDGSINWMRVVPATDSSPGTTAKGKTPSIQVSVAELKLSDGQVHFLDRVPATPFRTDLSAVQANVKQFATPGWTPAAVELSFDTAQQASFALRGSFNLAPLASEGSIQFTAARPGHYAPYYEQYLVVDFADGKIAGSTNYRFEMPEGGTTQFVLSGIEAKLTSLRVRRRDTKEEVLKLALVSVSGGELDFAARSAQIGTFQVREGHLRARRFRDGTVDLAQLSPKAGPVRRAVTAAESAQPSKEWAFVVKRLSAERLGVTVVDEVPPEPVTHLVDPITLKAENLSNRKGTKARVALDLRVNRTGTLRATGQAGINPIAGSLDVRARGLEVLPFQPYFQDKVSIVVNDGALNGQGRLDFDLPPQGTPRIRYAGELALTDFASVDKQNGEDFLNWQSLYLTGVNAISEPFGLAIHEAALTDFYSRIIVFANGRINLQDIAVPQEAAAAARLTSRTAPGGQPPSRAPKAFDAGRKPEPAPEPAAAPPAQQAASGPLPRITIDRVTFQGGEVNFTDLFIKPNYSAELTEIGGAVIGLSSDLNTTADLELRGKYAKAAPLEIKGKINPLVRNLYLDATANVRDIELGPFSPYSGKYVGYAIEKGKMSFDVAYKVENRKLDAKNHIVLNQLTFGEKVQSPQATKLPVLLAVALLRDRNGVIDVELPISGSIDDPKFSIGGIIIKIIINLIEKAVTAPFALIGHLVGGGGEQLAYVEFEPGRTTLDQANRDKLAKLQQALIDRPALKLDIKPRVDPGTDTEGLRRYQFEQKVKAQKQREMAKQGQAVDAPDAVSIDPAEYDRYLRKAYREAKFPKPRNILGFQKDLPAEEMEKLMLTNAQVGDDDLIQLANARGQAAKDFITQGGKVAPERVFLLAPKVEPAKADDKLKPGRVEFSLK